MMSLKKCLSMELHQLIVPFKPGERKMINTSRKMKVYSYSIFSIMLIQKQAIEDQLDERAGETHPNI